MFKKALEINRDFVVLTTQRSGSTWVIDMLGSHSHIKAYTELFLKVGHGYPPWSREQDLEYWNTYSENRLLGFNRIFRTFVLFQYLNKCFDKDGGATINGFKLMYDQLRRYPELVFYFIIKKVRIVHLYRDNCVAAVLSNVLREKRNTAHVRKGQIVPEVTIEIECNKIYKEIRRFHKKVKIMKRLITLLPVQSLHVSYEELADDPAKYSRIISFLGVENRKLTSSLQRLHKKPVGESVINIDELYNLLTGTEYEAMLKAIM